VPKTDPFQLYVGGRARWIRKELKRTSEYPTKDRKVNEEMVMEKAREEWKLLSAVSKKIFEDWAKANKKEAEMAELIAARHADS